MKKLIVGSGVAAGVVVVGVFAGYWHFAELLPERQDFAQVPAASDAPPEPAAETPPAPSEAADVPATEPAQSPAAPQETAATEPEAPEAPSFELLRVEPDGSAVIAGRAAPGSEVELLSGGEVVGRERASPSGDFAMALSEPLSVGEHELSLQAQGEAGEATPSAEAAIVSVPEPGRESELLVALGTPNEPTRILQRPAAPEAPEAETEAAPSEQTDPEVAAAATAAKAADELSDTLQDALSIAAVEIERDRIYVAGTTRPGGRVRVYLDDEFIAEGQGTGGDFIAEGRADVSVGSHRVRADEIGPDGSVVARVEVPFDRPEGESMAALAPGMRGGPAPAPAEEPDAPAVEEPSAPAPEAEETIAAAPELQPQPQPAPTAPARSEPAQAPRSMASTAAETPSAGEPVAAPAPEPDTASATTAPPAPTATPPAPQVEAEAPVSADEEAGSTEETHTQAALEPVEGRVIIRRGDTLWRISRETYGLGRRYTVIYLANGDQIRDPNRIYPGQIFRLPEDEENGEQRSELR